MQATRRLQMGGAERRHGAQAPVASGAKPRAAPPAPRHPRRVQECTSRFERHSAGPVAKLWGGACLRPRESQRKLPPHLARLQQAQRGSRLRVCGPVGATSRGRALPSRPLQSLPLVPRCQRPQARLQGQACGLTMAAAEAAQRRQGLQHRPVLVTGPRCPSLASCPAPPAQCGPRWGGEAVPFAAPASARPAGCSTQPRRKHAALQAPDCRRQRRSCRGGRALRALQPRARGRRRSRCRAVLIALPSVGFEGWSLLATLRLLCRSAHPRLRCPGLATRLPGQPLPRLECGCSEWLAKAQPPVRAARRGRRKR